ncbi:hypothetical protein CP532_6744 [Ophiocordyceps camponoti-leonardi (nom. inval.)]|nr:hypothetical protein CP532_6744 [Ophiocordyceps camponoti-leonardi (nom. inval.)]
MLKTALRTQRSRISRFSPSMSTTEDALRPSPPPPSSPPPPPTRPHPPSMYFPLGYKDAVYQWWTSVTPNVAERNVLSFIPHLREEAVDASTKEKEADPFGNRLLRRSLVPLSGKNRALNEVCVEREGERVDETLVMVHGYGAGLGFFYKNMEPISRLPGLKLYALDMLGMGNSSRPGFKIRARDREQQVIEAEDWFVDALEEWRKERKLDRFTLLGHSLGGYLAVSYALKYPGHLKKLILASPVGIPEDPYAVNASMPEPQESTLQSEFTEDQRQTVAAAANSTTTTTTTSSATTTATAPKRPLPSWLVWLWDANISPFSIIRLTGPLGPRFVSGWTARRFNHLPAAEAQALHDYSFSIFKQKGSGEYALGYILAPGAYARRPVINRIHHVGRQVDSHGRSENGLPVVFMYGENDWMDVAAGRAAARKLDEARARAVSSSPSSSPSPSSSAAQDKGAARVVVVPKAGHHLYLDNPDFFNQVLREEMEETMRAEKQQSVS